ncbi:MAG: biotin transporter BioY [Gemmatimonadaceae bacterium]|nr:biotin transporter BioY [Gemmatimonadaceae bacterium]NUQ94782.1 biotin transporter BioY [Gemmatimonadaceae bacterium]
MTTLTLARSDRYTVAKVIGFAVALAAASQVAIPIPGTPVPITLQPMLVVLAGFWLAPRAAVASMALYLAAGALGAPVFTPIGAPGVARLLGPTGGYLLAYPVAALVASLLARRAGGLAGRFVAAVAAMAVIYLGGLSQLAIVTGSFTAAALLGAAPFAALDLVKCAVAALLAPKRLSEAR